MAIAQDQPTTTGTRSRALLIAGLCAVAFLLVVARWLTTPYDDWVPVTPRQGLPAEIVVDDLPDAAHYRCSALLDSASATPTEQAAEAETHQDLTREPCSEFRTGRKVLGASDLVVGLAVLTGLVVFSRRRSS
jgi:hypothetical protein